jgi:hypothetical protein
MTNTAFNPTHIFILLTGEEVPVVVEERSDFVAFEADGTSWYTVMGPMSEWWSCRARVVTKVKEVRRLTVLPSHITRKKLEALVWKHTHEDFKGKREDGTKCVLHMETGVTYGTESWSLSKFTDSQLIAKLPRSVRENNGL